MSKDKTRKLCRNNKRKEKEMERKVTKIVQGKRTKDGAGVSLVRILEQTSKSRTGNSQLDKTLISLNSQPSTLITSHLPQLSTLTSQHSTKHCMVS